MPLRVGVVFNLLNGTKSCSRKSLAILWHLQSQRIAKLLAERMGFGPRRQLQSFSLRSCRSSSVIFFLLIFRGEIWWEIWREFCRIFLTHRIKAQRFRGKYRSDFRKKIRSSNKKSFAQNSLCRRATVSLRKLQKSRDFG